MTGPEIVDFEVYQGSKFECIITIKDPVTKLPADLTGLGVRGMLRKTGVATPVSFVATILDQTVTETKGQVMLVLGAETKTAGMAKGSWKYDIEVYNLTDSDDVAKPIAGVMIIKEQQTRT